jgi:uncharacterized protein
MKQSISLITLGVSDYEQAKAFYGAIGWSPAMDVEETVRVGRRRAGAQRRLRGGVSAVTEEARANSVEIIREPSPTFHGGYAGGFRDPDGHVWEARTTRPSGWPGTAVILPER